MKKLTKRIDVTGTDRIGMLDEPATIEFDITQKMMQKIVGLVESELLGFGDRIIISLGGVEAFDEVDAAMDLDWRPDGAEAVLFGELTMNSILNGMFIVVRSKDDDSELLHGTLKLTQEEIDSLVSMDDEDGVFEVWTETTLIRASEIISGKRGDILDRVEDGDLNHMYQGEDINCESVVMFRKLSASEVAELAGKAA